MLGSRVLPDLEETMQMVFLRSSFFSTALTWAGSVESSTWSSGYPPNLPKVRRRTSTQRLEPPMPRRTAWRNLAFLISAASFLRLASSFNCSSTMVSQPSHLPSSVPVQSEGSFCHRRATLLLVFQSAREVFTPSERAAGSL